MNICIYTYCLHTHKHTETSTLVCIADPATHALPNESDVDAVETTPVFTTTTTSVPGILASASTVFTTPAPTSTSQTGYSESEGECTAGFSGPDGGPCTACVAGKYKTASGSAACTNRPGAVSFNEQNTGGFQVKAVSFNHDCMSQGCWEIDIEYTLAAKAVSV